MAGTTDHGDGAHQTGGRLPHRQQEGAARWASRHPSIRPAARSTPSAQGRGVTDTLAPNDEKE